jgi:PKD repeat protein
LAKVLVALLALDIAGSGAAFARDPAPAGATLTVSSEPLGAMVYVDGEAQGATPLEVTKLSPGDHRVRVEKDGYLENSRLVSVASGQSRAVQVKLTPDSGARFTTTTQVEKKGGGGGGSKKGLWIALGVVAVGAGVALALAGGNEAPTVSATTATPTTGLAAATSIQFSTTASDPDGDALTYSWNFGDGGTGSGSNPTHVYQNAGTFNVTVTVSDSKASATGNTSVTIRSLSGTWRGTLDNFFNSTVSLTQNGATLSGSYSDQFAPDTTGPVTGSVSGPNRVTITVDPACCVPFTFSGTIDEALNRISGTTNGSGFVNAPWALTRQ